MSLRHHFEPENNVRLARLCGPLDAHLRRIEDALGVGILRRGAVFTVDGPGDAAQRALELMKTLYAQADRPIYEQALELAVAEALAAARPEVAAGTSTPGPPVGPDLPESPGASAAAARGVAEPAAARQTFAGAVLPDKPRAGRPSMASRDQMGELSPDAVPLTVMPDVAETKKSLRKITKARAFDSATKQAPAAMLETAAPALASTSPLILAEPKPVAPDGPQAPAQVQPVEVPAQAAEPVLHTRRSELRGRTPNQVRYLSQMLSHDVTFGIGPAGTGKTFLAVACAVDALERHSVQRLVLTRPAVEAGERLGFLPGDLAQKVDPYLRPLYDALYDLMGFDRVAKAFEKGLIEIAPLAFMRGRTLNHAFVILDEAQNTTREQMKMFLTRLGFGSRCVVTGDVSQIDLPSGVPSGLIDAEQVLSQVPGIAFTRFTPADVVRHPLVARIVEAYDQARDRR